MLNAIILKKRSPPICFSGHRKFKWLYQCRSNSVLRDTCEIVSHIVKNFPAPPLTYFVTSITIQGFYLIFYLKKYSFIHFHLSAFPYISPTYAEFSLLLLPNLQSTLPFPLLQVKPFQPFLLVLICISLTNISVRHFQRYGFLVIYYA